MIHSSTWLLTNSAFIPSLPILKTPRYGQVHVKLFTVFKNSGLPGLAMLHLKVLENSSVFFATELAKTLVQVFRKFE